MWTVIKSFLTGNWIQISVIVAVLTMLNVWHSNSKQNLHDHAYKSGYNQAIIDFEDATAKIKEEQADAAKEIHNTVNTNTTDDNLGLLFEQAIIIPDSGPTVQPKPDCTNHDAVGQDNTPNDEPYIYKLDDFTGTGQTEPRKDLPGACYQITFEPPYGYIINPLCEE